MHVTMATVDWGSSSVRTLATFSVSGLLREPFSFEPCCLMAPPPPPLFPPPPHLWKRGDPVSVPRAPTRAYQLSQLGHWVKPSSLFRLKSSQSLLQPGRDQDKPRCLRGPPGPPGPRGPEVRANFRAKVIQKQTNLSLVIFFPWFLKGRSGLPGIRGPKGEKVHAFFYCFELNLQCILIWEHFCPCVPLC